MRPTKDGWVPLIMPGSRDWTTHFHVQAVDEALQASTDEGDPLLFEIEFVQARGPYQVVHRRLEELGPNATFVWNEWLDRDELPGEPLYARIFAHVGRFIGQFWLSYEAGPKGPVTWGFDLPTAEDTLPGAYQSRFDCDSGIIAQAWAVLFLPKKSGGYTINRPFRAWDSEGDRIVTKATGEANGIHPAGRVHLLDMRRDFGPDATHGKFLLSAEGEACAGWSLFVSHQPQRVVGERWALTHPWRTTPA